MIKIFLLFILSITLFGSKILSYNIYERTDRVDVMITFDTPYTGKITQSTTDSTISIKLQDATIESAKLKQISSNYVSSMSITPMAGYTKIVLSVAPSVKLHASKTSDSYGLRLRFTTKNINYNTKKSIQNQQSSQLSNLPTKKDTNATQRYYIVIAILVVGIILLLLLKKRVTPAKLKAEQNKHKTSKQSWLFKDTPTAKTPSISNHEVSIRFQQALDDKNSVVMLDFKDQSYLVLMGSSNVLLDRFSEDKPQSQSEFDTILQSRHEELENFLNPKTQNNTPIKEPLQSYKEKASISYEV